LVASAWWPHIPHHAATQGFEKTVPGDQGSSLLLAARSVTSRPASVEDDDRPLPLPPLEPVTASSPALHLVEPNPQRQQKPSQL
jgi:hypothetical protein